MIKSINNLPVGAARRIANRAVNLEVKELASALGVCANYVYEMRRCGFVMRGVNRYRQVATVEEARAWIEANGFRVMSGAGVLSGKSSGVSGKS